MGSAVAAPLAFTANDFTNIINEALTVRPEQIQPGLRALLELDLHGLCEAHKRLSLRGTGPVSGTELEHVLGLPSLTCKVIIAGRSSIGVLELLTLLAILSQTHSHVKARFIWCMAHHADTGRLGFQEFKAASISFLRSTCFLAKTPRGQWPKAVAVEVLVTPLFERLAPGIAKDDFVSFVMNIGPLARMLQHFARRSVDQNFRLAEVFVANKADGKAEPGQSIESILPARTPTQTRKAKSQRPKSAHACFAVRPRQMVTPSPAPEEVDVEEDFKKGSKTPSMTVRTPSRPSSSCGVRHRGYFQNVPSEREKSLMADLTELQQERAASKKAERDVGLEMEFDKQEERLRDQIHADISDEDRRRTYRKGVDDIRCGLMSAPHGVGILPAGALWTASEGHFARGGSLPSQIARPLTPENVHKRINNHSSRIRKKQVLESLSDLSSDPASPRSARDVFDQYMQHATAGKILQQGVGQGKTRRHSSQHGGTQRRSSLESHEEGTESSATEPSVAPSKSRHRFYENASPADVLIAFELYRKHYWRRDGGEEVHRFQRDADINAILAEVASETQVWRDCTVALRTLRNFFQSIWPGLTNADFKSMCQIIEKSKTPEVVQAPVKMDSQQKQAETLRELVDLFDAIDKKNRGVVPLEAVEQFLCGELLTARESEQLATQQGKFGSALVGVPAGCEAYVDSVTEPGRCRFIMMQVQDRDEWSVTVGGQERRWEGTRQEQKRPSVSNISSPCTKPVAGGTDQPQMNAAKAKSTALYRIIGQRMDKLARFIDGKGEDALAKVLASNNPHGAPPHPSDAQEDLSGSYIEIVNGDLDIACKPGLIPEDFRGSTLPKVRNAVPDKEAGRRESTAESVSSLESEQGGQNPGTLRLVRLYWRYLLGSAVQQQLRDTSGSEQTYLNLNADGQVDLVGFICILAHEQLKGLFPKGAAPTAQGIREAAYAN